MKTPETQVQKVTDLLRASADRGNILSGLVSSLQLAATSGQPSDAPPSIPSPSDLASANNRMRPSPFADLVAALSAEQTNEPCHYSAPPSRFMVREVKVGRAPRATKRNYNYFQELEVALARQQAERLRTKGTT